ncbi:hypothetical protein AMTR_s00065p00190870 [Amborella trichopoda]|uniref:Uncharacterized protein n=1 Tax=Amborella trichopoda TaxID=13333 RepID=U5DB65_AMBTC|nr:hypothetical protein AMTR_s00065p00190870 [Amborella trichopoda]
MRPKIRVVDADEAFVMLINACGETVEVMPSTKCHVTSLDPHFLGAHWEAMNTASHSEFGKVVDASSGLNYNSADYSFHLKRDDTLVNFRIIRHKSCLKKVFWFNSLMDGKASVMGIGSPSTVW